MKRLFLAPTLATYLMLLPLVGQADPLQDAMDMAARKDWPSAVKAAEGLGPVARDLIAWSQLRAGEGFLGDFETFLQRRADWPGLALLRAKGEIAVARSNTPERIIAWFGSRDPVTAKGAEALARALRASGQGAKATEMLVRVWPELTLSEAEQSEFIAAAGASLGPKAHQARLDALLWLDRRSEARLMLPLLDAGYQKLAEARLALREDRDGVDSLLAAVPSRLAQDAGLAHARFEWRARKGRTEGALEILRERSGSAEALGRPEAWARRRGVLARAELRAGRGQAAYEIAAQHHLERGSAKADLEFLAGFAALRFLKDPAKALGHFEHLAEVVSTPISLSRAEYWQGRALQALNRPQNAKAAFTRAAQHQTAYYGLLAAEELGLPLDATLAAPPALPDWRQGQFLNSSVTEAALLFYRLNQPARARQFLLHLAEGLDAQGLASLGAFALDKGDDHLAVLIGKQAASGGIILPGIYFPETRLLPQEGLAVPRPLALAIARRESEFRADAVSPAGALGLMQLMPGTAKMMAAKLGLPDKPDALTSDPVYNARLGSAYLAHLAEEFGESIALRAAGYNAGPGRPRSWILDLGDPRHSATDVIDWVEMVPFEETRTYIMRVSEGVAIYAARQKPAAAVAITPLLRGTSSP